MFRLPGRSCLLLPLLASALWLIACSSKKDAATETTGKELRAVPGIQPVNLPNPNIPGFSFPDTVNILPWVNQQDSARIYLHGWGLWTALTATTGQVYNGDSLLVYETWQTKYELDSILQNALPRGGQAGPGSKRLDRGSPKRVLDHPRQFLRAPELARHNRRAHGLGSASADSSNNLVLEQVSYNPSAATSILTGKLFWASTLKKMLLAKQTDLANFQTDAIALKPMYEIVPGPQRSSGLYRMKVWTGTPPSPPDTGGYAQAKWPYSVYVDINNRGQGKGAVSTGTAPAPSTTYNLTDFLYYRLTAAEATALNNTQQPPAAPLAQPGDYAILVGMHITTNEIPNWTWQTMWWTPNPTGATSPSSPGIVAAKPPQLKGAARNYAMAIGYQMTQPSQPPQVIFSGVPVYQAQSVYVFNPYLEAPFPRSTFRQPAVLLTNNTLVYNNVGIRTNCMSCHAQASYKYTPGYIGNTYIELDSTSPNFQANFKGALRTDFLWSIPDMATFTADSAR